jgi:hypothetical protein
MVNFDLVPSCVSENYVRHDESGDRIVTRDAYAKEIAQLQSERPGIGVVVYDHSFEGDRAWFRFAFKWHDAKTSEAHSRAGMQSYRTEGDKLAETWLAMMPMGSAWTDPVAQEHWTTLRHEVSVHLDETAVTAKAAAEFRGADHEADGDPAVGEGREGTRPFFLGQSGLDVRLKVPLRSIVSMFSVLDVKRVDL